MVNPKSTCPISSGLTQPWTRLLDFSIGYEEKENSTIMQDPWLSSYIDRLIIVKLPDNNVCLPLKKREPNLFDFSKAYDDLYFYPSTKPHLEKWNLNNQKRKRKKRVRFMCMLAVTRSVPVDRNSFKKWIHQVW